MVMSVTLYHEMNCINFREYSANRSFAGIHKISLTHYGLGTEMFEIFFIFVKLFKTGQSLYIVYCFGKVWSWCGQFFYRKIMQRFTHIISKENSLKCIEFFKREWSWWLRFFPTEWSLLETKCTFIAFFFLTEDPKSVQMPSQCPLCRSIQT